jgi:FkbM family methyltransferase
MDAPTDAAPGRSLAAGLDILRSRSAAAWARGLGAAVRALPTEAARWRLRRAVLRFRPRLPRDALILPGDTVLQVGIAVPATARTIMRLVGRSGRAVFVEPVNHQAIRAALDAMGVTNATVVPAAASDTQGRARLLVAARSLDHRLEDPAIAHDNDLVAARDGGYRTEDVEVDTVEHLLDELGIPRIDYADVQVNGSELKVLRGMGRYLELTERLFVKAHARDSRTGTPLAEPIAAFLAERGFRVLRTRPSRAADPAWGPRRGDVVAWRPR